MPAEESSLSEGFRPGTRLALDWGEARIGVAACDPAGTLAYPVGTVAAGAAALDQIADLVAEYDPLEVVVGLPVSLSGSDGPAAIRVRRAATELAGALGARDLTTPVRLIDERLSTTTAAQQLRAAGKRGRDQRSRIDAAAAVVILEHALDAERAGNSPPGQLLSLGRGIDQPPPTEGAKP